MYLLFRSDEISFLVFVVETAFSCFKMPDPTGMSDGDIVAINRIIHCIAEFCPVSKHFNLVSSKES